MITVINISNVTDYSGETPVVTDSNPVTTVINQPNVVTTITRVFFCQSCGCQCGCGCSGCCQNG
ncbi:MAG: hypothetical protein K2N17_06590 [Clostridia bacterium]|nr:hypothetical protein [Clostridia bacterium]